MAGSSGGSDDAPAGVAIGDVASLANRLDAALPSLGGWSGLVERWRHGPEGRRLMAGIAARERDGATILPPRPLRALALTPPEAVRVVIVGQDPYHGPGQADGLAFSVPAGVPKPPSLRNIDAELARDLGLRPPAGGDLSEWARRGVLLLNTSLTVEAGQAAAHAGWGWESLVRALLDGIARGDRPTAFLCWGAHAQRLVPSETVGADGRHLRLCANHPSPLAARRPPRPFIGCGHFGLSARWLDAAGGATSGAQAPPAWRWDRDDAVRHDVLQSPLL